MTLRVVLFGSCTVVSLVVVIVNLVGNGGGELDRMGRAGRTVPLFVSTKLNRRNEVEGARCCGGLGFGVVGVCAGTVLTKKGIVKGVERVVSRSVVGLVVVVVVLIVVVRRVVVGTFLVVLRGGAVVAG